MTKAFRPQAWSGRYKLKYPRVGLYHWMPRRRGGSHIHRVAGVLHYLASHAPSAVSKKWQPAWVKFSNRYRKSV